jgi:Spy/CpxP family protein refolding chaperone
MMGGMMGGGMMGMGMMMKMKFMMMAEKLGLSEDQQKQMGEIFMNSNRRKIDLKCKMGMLKLDLMGMMWQEDKDMGAIEAKVRELANLKADRKLTMIQMMNDMKNVLTPEQRQEMMKMSMHWMKKGGMGGGMGEEGGEEMEEEEEGEESEEED